MYYSSNSHLSPTVSNCSQNQQMLHSRIVLGSVIAFCTLSPYSAPLDAGRRWFRCSGSFCTKKGFNFFLDKQDPPLILNSPAPQRTFSIPSPGRIPGAHPPIHFLGKQTNEDVAPRPAIIYNTFNHLTYEKCRVSSFYLLASFILIYYLPATPDYFQLVPVK